MTFASAITVWKQHRKEALNQYVQNLYTKILIGDKIFYRKVRNSNIV